jgi:hypothetical protein
LAEVLLIFAFSRCWSLEVSLISPCERFIVRVAESVSTDEDCGLSLVVPWVLWSRAVLKRY